MSQIFLWYSVCRKSLQSEKSTALGSELHIREHLNDEFTWRIIYPVFGVDTRVLLFKAPVRVNPWIHDCEIWPKKLEKPCIVWCKAYFDILSRRGVTYECDGQTNRHSHSKCRHSLRCVEKNRLMRLAKVAVAHGPFESIARSYFRVTESLEVSSRPTQTVMDENHWERSECTQHRSAHGMKTSSGSVPAQA